jgi:ribonuclease-3
LIFKSIRTYFIKSARNQAKIFDLFSRTIHYKFKNKILLRKALTHRSYLNNNMKRNESNERLEFLGDAVLDLIVGEEFYKMFPDKDEGDLTKLKSFFVNQEALANKARQMNLNQFILLGEGEDQSGGRNRDTILSDALEALVGAIYLDKGLAKVKKFIKQFIINDVKKFRNKPIPINYKSKLLEFIQDTTQTIPKYRIINERGPDHNKTFTVEVLVDGRSYGIGKGKSKKKAEHNAAQAAISKIGLENK